MLLLGLGACSAVTPEVGPLRVGDAGAEAGTPAVTIADASPEPSPAPEPPRTWTVEVGANDSRRFSPETLTIRSGDTVRWVFRSEGHTVTSGSGSADARFCSPADTNCGSAPTSNAGDVYEHRFTAPGSYAYFCRPHRGMMTGTIVVL